ncbi:MULTISPECIES: hypothetical protein [Mycolicibacter]|uniref:Uncharacterized protein n=1 Tax=Mycolicibacter virginiensis TaxID=1795032 RepID=A0A9X7IQ68_9MYCO|nr:MULTISPECIES: hypothetical protein [Mycolicibacter]PQM53442.1 hypothetical protein C5U48_04650 [Mycolicibacter virginiensis]ULP46363.1 hypothetical protein MJO54_16200 [Mycolicibacter virginiensis]
MNDAVDAACTGGPDHSSPRPALLQLWEQWAAFKPFAVAGASAIVAGGAIAAAIAAPAPTRHGVWAVAYLVLVLGAGQLVIGSGQALLPTTSPSPREATLGAAAFNLSGAAIVVGVVTDHIAVFYAGSGLLFIVLAWWLYRVRRSTRRGWALLTYRLFLAALVVSIPIGMAITTAGRS